MRYNRINKSYEELTIADDFMFFKVMSDEEMCNEDKELILEDGITKVFINATANVDGEKPGFGSLIKYINTGEVSDMYTKKIDNVVVSSRKSKSWRREYMKYLADKTDLLEQGKLLMILELYEDGAISLEKAIEKSELSEESFLEKYEEYKAMN